MTEFEQSIRDVTAVYRESKGLIDVPIPEFLKKPLIFDRPRSTLFLQEGEMSAPSMREPNYEQEWAELYDEKAQKELELCQRISRGLATYEDALYVSWLCGLTTEFKGAENANR